MIEYWMWVEKNGIKTGDSNGTTSKRIKSNKNMALEKNKTRKERREK